MHRLLSFLLGLLLLAGVGLPAAAQPVTIPNHRELGAAQLYDSAGNPVGTAANPLAVNGDLVATGTVNAGTGNAAYAVALAGGKGSIGFNVTGLGAAGATLAVEFSNDGGATWSAGTGYNAGTAAWFSTLTADQQFRVDAGGHTNVRLRVSATGSGTITVASVASTATPLVTLVPGGAVSISQGGNTAAVNGSGQLAVQAPPSLPLPSNAAQETGGNLAQIVTDSGAPGATACGSDTGSCSFNQLLQRLAQRLTTINATLNAPLQQSGGTVAATQSTTPWLTKDAATGATGSAPPSSAIYPGADVGGNLTGKIACGSSALYDASTSGETQLVALSSGKTIYVCGYTIFAAGAVNVNLAYGTGTACASGTTKVTPAFQLAAQTGVADGSPEYRGLATAASNALCLNASGAVAVQAIIYFTQF